MLIMTKWASFSSCGSSPALRERLLLIWASTLLRYGVVWIKTTKTLSGRSFSLMFKISCICRPFDPCILAFLFGPSPRRWPEGAVCGWTTQWWPPPTTLPFATPHPQPPSPPSPCLSSCPFSDSVRPNWRSGVPGKEKHPLTNTDRNVAAAATMVKSQLGLKISLITGLFFL